MSEITLNSLPKTLDELKAMPQAALTVPEEVAALTVAALALYPENPAETEKMLDFLRGPRPLNGIDKQFIRDRFRGKEYLMRSYLVGSTRKTTTHLCSRTESPFRKTLTAGRSLSTGT